MTSKFNLAMTKLETYIDTHDAKHVHVVSSQEGHTAMLLTKQGDSIPLINCTSQREALELTDMFNTFIDVGGEDD